MATNTSTIAYRKDMRITMPTNTSQRCTLYIDKGDIQLVDGRTKLVEQLIRAIVNDNTMLRDLINTTGATERQFYTLMVTILTNFKNTQSNEVYSSETDFSGYNIYRKAAGTNDSYALVSKNPIIYKFVDTNVVNGIKYNYGLAKVYNDVFETEYVDSYYIGPSQFATQQELLIKKYSIAWAGSSAITFYVDYNKRFRTDELLSDIKSIVPYQDGTDPRMWHVNIVVEDYSENAIGITSEKISL